MGTPPLPVDFPTHFEIAMGARLNNTIQFDDASGKPLFTIYTDKPRVVLAPGVRWDAASKAFWRDLEMMAPICPTHRGKKP
jgi:hypothetical protein